ncbi:MAG: gamma-glutamyl-gamma-aminobutyrate hydrolase family protein [Candidatus Paceibacterota bacterium]
MKKIAITSSIISKDNRINTAYITAFTNNKTLPIIIPTIVNKILDYTDPKKEKEYKEKAEEIAKTCDALILTGGADINPLIYDKKNNNSIACNTKRDKTDLYLIEAFIKEQKPIMGICRGMQILGLIFKLPNFKQNLSNIEELHNANTNELATRQEFAHTIKIYGSLEKYFIENKYITEEKENINVNSFHHQGFAFIERKQEKTTTINTKKEIEEINEKTELNILASTDRIIEAFEHKKLPIFAVQWHPEEYGNKSAIINYFINKYLKT